jgi:ribonuclease BN (tRNA processing enzyme)
VRVHVLGCGDAFGSGGRNQSSYLVDAGDRLFLLDCGATALLAMKRAGFSPDRLDAILLSHLHGDHFGGVPFFLIDYLYRVPRHDPLTIAGPAGTEERVRRLFNDMYESGKNSADTLPVEFMILTPGERQNVSGIEVFPFRVPHQTNAVSLGLKVSYRGKRILYSGDSQWTDVFIEHSDGVDLFLCECSFFEEQPGKHVNYRILEANLERLRSKRLVLTHLGEEMLARRGQLSVLVAEDGMVIEI